MRAKIFMFVAAAMLVSASAFAQQTASESSASTDCTYNFTSGAGATRLAWCVSAHGNLMKMESPQGFEHIRIGDFVEGYALCSGTTILASDFGNVESGWGPPTLIAGPSGSGVTLRRFSTSGAFQLDMKFSRDSKENDITVLMTVKNLGPTVVDVRLARVVDWDVDNSPTGDTFDRSNRGVWAREVNGVTHSNIKFVQAVDTAVVGFSGSIATCSPTSVATPAVLDGMSVITARLGPLNTGKAANTTFVYRRQ